MSQKNLRYPGGRSTTGSSNKRMRFLPEVKRKPWTATRTIAAYADPVDVLHRLQWQSSNGAMIEVASNSTVPHKHPPLIIGWLRLSGRLTFTLTGARGAAVDKTRRLRARPVQRAVRPHQPNLGSGCSAKSPICGTRRNRPRNTLIARNRFPRYRTRAGPIASLSSSANLVTAMMRNISGIVGHWLALK